MDGNGFQMQRCFIEKNEDHTTGSVINICGDDFRHFRYSLRIREGEKIILCDGEMNDYTVCVDEILKDHIRTKVISADINEAEPYATVVLYQGMPRADKMDIIVRESVEAGVSYIRPILTERSVPKPGPGNDYSGKTARWNRISAESAMQSGRGIIPKISGPLCFMEALDISVSESDLLLIAYENEKKRKIGISIAEAGLSSLNPAPINGKKPVISIFIGPEGGFGDKEIQQAQNKGAVPVTLGRRILRTETAPAVALALIHSSFGEM